MCHSCAVTPTQVEKGPMWQLLFWISLAEILLIPTVIDMDKKDRAPGDFALDPLNLCKVLVFKMCTYSSNLHPSRE